jgi:hypothetical protein
MSPKLLTTTAVAALLGAVAAATPASADTFNLTSCHLSGGCDAATQFGTVTLTQVTGTTVQFDVALNVGNRFVETVDGAGSFFLFNDSIGSSAITGITVAINGSLVNITGGLTGLTNQSPIMADSTGLWTAQIFCTDSSQCTGASTPNINELHFNVTNATIDGLSKANNLGNVFVADILCGQPGCTGLTGPVDATLGVPGPIAGAGIPGIIVGCFALWGLMKRGRRRYET